jgi:hypothetical protein
MYTPVHLMMMVNMSIVMQLVRCATGGLNWEAVMQSGKDRDAGYTMVEARRKRMVGKRKRKSQIISRRQAKAVCGRHVKRVWKREDVQRVIVAEAGSVTVDLLYCPPTQTTKNAFNGNKCQLCPHSPLMLPLPCSA